MHTVTLTCILVRLREQMVCWTIVEVPDLFLLPKWNEVKTPHPASFIFVVLTILEVATIGTQNSYLTHLHGPRNVLAGDLDNFLQ